MFLNSILSLYRALATYWSILLSHMWWRCNLEYTQYFLINMPVVGEYQQCIGMLLELLATLWFWNSKLPVFVTQAECYSLSIIDYLFVLFPNFVLSAMLMQFFIFNVFSSCVYFPFKTLSRINRRLTCVCAVGGYWNGFCTITLKVPSRIGFVYYTVIAYTKPSSVTGFLPPPQKG